MRHHGRAAGHERLDAFDLPVGDGGGPVAGGSEQGDEGIAERADHVIPCPAAPELVQPMVLAVPLQLLAYHVAVLRSCDVDQPRNLAKSVTVE